ncbi:MarC family protein [Hydrogenophilus thiooxidans]|uniref:MarC family protein n=1 Tax=Hydrogenophilus thiooxidans TaxID=2820326 RepID=UPI001C227E13|nr:MarC family protein [Hydrogenophilus thiooxidans]
MTNELLSLLVLLLILLDPVGNIPLLISLLRGVAHERRVHIIVRENLIAAALLVLFVFFGDWLLSTLRLTPAALEISSGIILFLIAVRMVFPSPTSAPEEAMRQEEPLIVPIAVPMIAGPAALATVLLTARQGFEPLTLILAILAAVAINTVALLAGERIAQRLGRAGMAAMERLMGLILTTMAVQMLISGLRAAFFAAS